MPALKCPKSQKGGGKTPQLTARNTAKKGGYSILQKQAHNKSYVNPKRAYTTLTKYYCILPSPSLLGGVSL